MILIFGSPIALTLLKVSSEPFPTATTNSSTNGSNDRMDASKGKPSSTPLRMKVKPLIEALAFSLRASLVGWSGFDRAEDMWVGFIGR